MEVTIQSANLLQMLDPSGEAFTLSDQGVSTFDNNTTLSNEDNFNFLKPAELTI